MVAPHFHVHTTFSLNVGWTSEFTNDSYNAQVSGPHHCRSYCRKVEVVFVMIMMMMVIIMMIMMVISSSSI